MASRKNALPDAWDDDWEKAADSQEATTQENLAPEGNLSRAERKAKHQEANKQLWEAADTTTSAPIFLQTRPSPPLQTILKPAVKVLSRRPPPKAAAPTDGDDSEEEERKRSAAEFAERQARAAKEREEKQRKYAEVRERLFGSGSASVSGGSGNEEKSKSNSRPGSSNGLGKDSGRNTQQRNKGRGKAGGEQGQGSPARGPKENTPSASRVQLYDPGYAIKPNSVYVQRKETGETGPSVPAQVRPMREPKGPDGSAGFGFAARGKGSTTGNGAAT